MNCPTLAVLFSSSAAFLVMWQEFALICQQLGKWWQTTFDNFGPQGNKSLPKIKCFFVNSRFGFFHFEKGWIQCFTHQRRTNILEILPLFLKILILRSYDTGKISIFLVPCNLTFFFLVLCNRLFLQGVIASLELLTKMTQP